MTSYSLRSPGYQHAERSSFASSFVTIRSQMTESTYGSLRNGEINKIFSIKLLSLPYITGF